MKNNIFLIKWLLFTLLICGLVYYFKPNITKYTAEFPYLLKNGVKNSTELACESLVYSGIRADKNFMNEKDGVKGEILKGTDKIAIKIEDKIIKFLTRASLEVGTAEGTPFTIVKNNNEELMAIDLNIDRGSVNTFLLEKKTGLAIWTKDRVKPSLTSDHPDSQSFYLICR